jgi:hypothetical protein
VLGLVASGVGISLVPLSASMDLGGCYATQLFGTIV